MIGPRAAAVNRRLEIPVLSIALLSIPLLALELAATAGWPSVVAQVIAWLIWGSLFIEVALIVILTHHPLPYLRRVWMYLLVIVLAFPPFSGLSSGGFVSGTWQTLRAVVLIALFIHSFTTLATFLKHLWFETLAIARHPWMFLGRPLLKWHGLGLVTIVFVLLAVGAGLLHALFEHRHPLEGLWWALVTLTTVGYGDITPVTLGGRITAALLMLGGVGVVATVTASIAARFVEGDHRKDLHREVLSIHERLDRIEKLLASRDSHPGSDSQPSGDDQSP